MQQPSSPSAGNSENQRIIDACSKEWVDLTKSRQFDSFESLPAIIQNRLIRIREVVNQLDQEANIRLIGSWVQGGWADETTSERILELRKLLKRKIGFSDLDIVVETKLKINSQVILNQLDFPVTLTFNLPNNQKHIRI